MTDGTPVIQCKTCDVGRVEGKTTYRMSGIVVAIGYILLIPSILGILFSVLLLFATGKARADSSSSLRTVAVKTIRESGVSSGIAEKSVSGQPLTELEKTSLSPDQDRAIESAQRMMTYGTAGTGFGIALAGGAALFFGVVSLVGGLLGWLLIMKKKILQCNNCGAVTAAS